MATIIRVVFLLLAATWPAFALSEQHADETFDVTAGAKLVIDVDFGTIDVTHGAENKIAVNVYRKIDGPTEALEKEYLASAPLTIAKEGNTVVVRAQRDSHKKNWSWSGHTTMLAHYTIKVPAEINAELSTGGGEISATEVSGSCKADTSGGDLKFIRMRGPLQASTSGGHISLEACDGALNIETSGGKIESLAGSGTLNATTSGGSIGVRNFNGDTKVETSGGALNLENIRGRLSGETAGGSITAIIPAPVPGDIKLETSAGGIEIAVPPDAGLDVKAETNIGGVRSDLPMITKHAGREGLQGTINGGGKSMVLRTGAGHIAIKSTNPAR
jgi:putative adhesin